MSFPIRKIGLLEMPKIAMLSTMKVPFSKRRKNHVFFNPENWNAGNAENCDAVYNQPRKFNYVLKVPFSKRRENHVFFNPENWDAGNAENCDAVYMLHFKVLVEI